MKLHEWNARLHGLVIFRSLLSDPVALYINYIINIPYLGNYRIQLFLRLDRK